MALQLKLFGENLLDIDGNPIKEEGHIVGGSELYRYLGLANLLQSFNSEWIPAVGGGEFQPHLLVSTPFSYNIDDTYIQWTSDTQELKASDNFNEKLLECFNSPTRFIVITLRLLVLRPIGLHANYIIIDKGTKINTSEKLTAIRIEPHGFCNTSEKYSADKLDIKLKTYLSNFTPYIVRDGPHPPKIVLLDEKTSDVTQQGISRIETRNRGDSNRIINTTGFCATHSFILIYLFFEIVKKNIPINFYYSPPQPPLYIFEGSYENIEGEKLFKDIFNALYYQFLYPYSPQELYQEQWVERLAIVVNQKISKLNTILLHQLTELALIGAPNTRYSESAKLYFRSITEEVHLTTNTPSRTCQAPENDCILLQIFNRIINTLILERRLTRDELYKIFTIYGINNDILVKKYGQYFPRSLPGGQQKRQNKKRKTKKAKQKKKNKKGKTKKEKQKRQNKKGKTKKVKTKKRKSYKY